MAEVPRLNLEIFGALIRDRRVPHGAFRLWHTLRDYTNSESMCFPGQRRLAQDIGCDIHSIKKWTQGLVDSGWLRVDAGKPGMTFTYTVLDGSGKPMRKSTKPKVATASEKRQRPDHAKGF